MTRVFLLRGRTAAPRGGNAGCSKVKISGSVLRGIIGLKSNCDCDCGWKNAFVGSEKTRLSDLEYIASSGQLQYALVALSLCFSKVTSRTSA